MGVGGLTASVSAGLVRQADQNVAVQTSLLKKAINADKDLVSTLLPQPPASASGLDIRA